MGRAELGSERRISSEIDQTVHSDITRLFWCTAVWYCSHSTMYCLQWLIPVLLLPKPVNPALLYNHVMFIVLYLTGFFLEKKPCTICSLVFIVAMVLICYSGYDSCLFWSFCNHQDVEYTCDNPQQMNEVLGAKDKC